MSFAPVALFVYNKIKTTIPVIEALKNNIGSDETDLYIFSNAPVPDTDDDITISLLRKELLSYKSYFKNFELVTRTVNNGPNDNMTDGINRVLESNDRVIVLEDDVITHPLFLVYMNKALDYYINSKDVFTICSYNPTPNGGKFKHPEGDTFMWNVFKCWGWATWKDRWKRVDIGEDVLSQVDLFKVRSCDIQLAEVIQNDIRREENERIDILDYKIMLKQLAENKYSIYPYISMSDAIGLAEPGFSNNKYDNYKNENFDINCEKNDWDYTSNTLSVYDNLEYYINFRRANCLIDVDNRGKRKDYLYSILFQTTTKVLCNRVNLAEWFKSRKIGSVGIYGYGDAGKILYEMIKEFVPIKYIVDRNKVIKHSGQESENGNTYLNSVDAMIITPIWDYYMIEEELYRHGMKCQIINMLDLMLSLNQSVECN